MAERKGEKVSSWKLQRCKQGSLPSWRTFIQPPSPGPEWAGDVLNQTPGENGSQFHPPTPAHGMSETGRLALFGGFG